MSIDRGMDKEDVAYTYAMKHHSAIEKNKTMSFAATWTNLEIIIINEVRQRKTNIMWYQLCLQSKIMIQQNLQNRNRLTDIEKKLMITQGEHGGKG